MASGVFKPSAAVRETNRALQPARRSRSTLNWDEITSAICGPYTSFPVDSAYIDGELDLAKATTKKSIIALVRNPCDLFTMPNADSALRELSGFGTCADLRNQARRTRHGALRRARRGS